MSHPRSLFSLQCRLHVYRQVKVLGSLFGSSLSVSLSLGFSVQVSLQLHDLHHRKEDVWVISIYSCVNSTNLVHNKSRACFNRTSIKVTKIGLLLVRALVSSPWPEVWLPPSWHSWWHWPPRHRGVSWDPWPAGPESSWPSRARTASPW